MPEIDTNEINWDKAAVKEPVIMKSLAHLVFVMCAYVFVSLVKCIGKIN